MLERDLVLKPPEIEEVIASDKTLQNLIFLAEASTRKRVYFTERQWMLPLGQFAYPQPGDKYHQIYYRPYQKFLVHTLSHELAHLIRFWFSPEVYRKTAIHDYDKACFKLSPELPKSYEDEWLNAQVGNIVRMLCDLPSDFYVESWLWVQYPEFREIQEATLREENGDFKNLNFSKPPPAPETLFEAERVMLCAEDRFYTQLIGNPLLNREQQGPYQSKAEQLVSFAFSIHDQGLKSNAELTDVWAEFLGIRDWFRWVPVW